MAIGHLAKYAFQRKQLEDIPNIDLRRRGQYNLSELNSLRRRLAKRANQRLRELERAGYTNSYVYSHLMSGYLLPSERTRFFEGSRQLDIYTLKEELEELRAFLSAKTSTVGGIRSNERRVAEQFKNLSSFKKSPDSFFKFLSSASVQHLKRLGYSSEELIEFYNRSVEEQVDYEQVMQAIKEFERGEIKAWDELYERVGMSYIKRVRG